MIAALRPFLRDTHGNAAAEFALMLPLLVLLLFGGMEMGNYFWSEHKAIKSAREGARYAARQPTSNFVCGATDLGAADTGVRNLIRTGTVDGTGSPVIPGWTDGASTIDIDVTCITGEDFSNGGIYSDQSGTGSPAMTSATQIAVAVEVPYPSLFGGLTPLGDLNIGASAQSAATGF